ncbi:MAG: nucleotide pyrophosphohydrolase [Anaerolineae bacterium]
MTATEPTLTELLAAVRRFRDERNWRQFHSPKNLSMSIAIEAAELMEHFQWLTPAEAEQLPRENPAARQAIEEELADVLIYCLSLADVLACDIPRIISDKLARNRQKYPAQLFHDRHSLPE